MPRFAANLTLLFNDVPFLERFDAAREAGFRGVEYLFPYEWPATTLRQRLDDTGLEQVLFNLPPGDWAAGERGIAGLPDRVSEFREGVDQALDYAHVLDCPRLNALAGLLPPDGDPQACRMTLIDNLRWAADRLATEGRTLLVEAINSRVDMPGFLLDTSTDALSVIEAVDRPNVLFQYDLYHMQIMEGDLIRTLRRSLSRIGHVQFADNPGRHEPGTGEVAFPAVFRALDEMGYDGWVSAEYRPTGSTLDSLDWLPARRQ
ncbi:hydroxypyruvate isomerase [Tamilnaduibacter salinus]|nr:hydroxypyruvate isomerase [Tamilnaduibacter salinus]